MPVLCICQHRILRADQPDGHTSGPPVRQRRHRPLRRPPRRCERPTDRAPCGHLCDRARRSPPLRVARRTSSQLSAATLDAANPLHFTSESTSSLRRDPTLGDAPMPPNAPKLTPPPTARLNHAYPTIVSRSKQSRRWWPHLLAGKASVNLRCPNGPGTRRPAPNLADRP